MSSNPVLPQVLKRLQMLCTHITNFTTRHWHAMHITRAALDATLNTWLRSARPQKPNLAPQFRKRFKPKQAESIIHEVLQEKLKGKAYAVDQVTALTKEISEAVKAQLLKELDIPRYKVIVQVCSASKTQDPCCLSSPDATVQVVVCEQKGEGVNMGCRCLWDPDSDSMALGQFSNDTIFCSATAFAIYHS